LFYVILAAFRVVEEFWVAGTEYDISNEVIAGELVADLYIGLTLRHDTGLMI
jgi:hypothetical protein